ncbi:MAG: hypothetical protein WCV90_00550 [Candidatus Woesearchaeota archaeon]
MDTLLLLILLIIGNLSLYWILFGKKRFEQKYMQKNEEEPSNVGKTSSN